MILDLITHVYDWRSLVGRLCELKCEYLDEFIVYHEVKWNQFSKQNIGHSFDTEEEILLRVLLFFVDDVCGGHSQSRKEEFHNEGEVPDNDHKLKCADIFLHLIIEIWVASISAVTQQSISIQEAH